MFVLDTFWFGYLLMIHFLLAYVYTHTFSHVNAYKCLFKQTHIGVHLYLWDSGSLPTSIHVLCNYIYVTPPRSPNSRATEMQKV